MLTANQAKFVELANKMEALKKEMKAVQPELDMVMLELGIGAMFQDPSTKIVYSIVEPNGTFTYFKKIDFHRTRIEGEKMGTLSKTEAKSRGFDVD